MATLAALITSLRVIAKDTPTSKVIFGEQLGGSDQPSFPVNGVNTVFRLKSVPLSDYVETAGNAAYTLVTIIGHGAVTRTKLGFAITDPVAGIITFTAAPDPGNGTYPDPNSPPDGVYVDYYYEWFTDTDYTEFLNEAAQYTLAGVSDPTAIASDLIMIMLQYALGLAMNSLASRFAMEYQSAGADASQNSNKSAQFRNIAKDAFTNAKNMQDNFYKGQGQQFSPASQDITLQWDPITPIR